MRVEDDPAGKHLYTVIREWAVSWTERGVALQVLMSKTSSSKDISPWRKLWAQTTPNQKTMLIANTPQKPDPDFCEGLESHLLSAQQPAASLVSLVARFSNHLNTLQERCDMQSAPCLKGDKIPLKIWPRWSTPINFGKACNAQQAPRCAPPNDEQSDGSGRDPDLVIVKTVRNSCQFSLLFFISI